jgi:8-oxo-dGTP pyrophosphatase MutT (NUDIX family)
MTTQILSIKKLIQGKWLSLKEINYIDYFGKHRKWESVERVASNGAVVILATLMHSKELILIRQYRPPVNNNIIEFPAGLIDDGETPEETATRELQEETGYTGKIISSSINSYSSPGLTSEKITFVKMLIDETLPENIHPQTKFDEGEFIELIKIPIQNLEEFIKISAKNGDSIDAKVLAFSEALSLSNNPIFQMN